MMGLAICLESFVAVMARACWQGSLVVLAVWVICRILFSMPAQVRCWLWRLACLKFILVLLLPAPVDLPWLPTPVTIFHPGSQIAAHTTDSSMDQVRGGNKDLPRLPLFLGILWITGFVYSIGRILMAWRKAKQLRISGCSCRCPLAIEQLDVLRRRFHLKTTPQFLEIAGSGSPMLTGILRPAIIIPVGTLHLLSPEEITVVLGHELAHIRCGDLLWNLIAAAVRAVFFFHPLVWLSQRQLDLSQEIAADSLAIAQQQCDPLGYGKLLVSVVGKLGPARFIPIMSMGAAGPLESLTRRLVAMKFTGRTSRQVRFASIMTLAAMVSVGIVPWRLIAAEPKDGKQPSQQYRATVTISEQEKGHPKTILSAPKVVCSGDQKAAVTVGDSNRRLEVTIGPSPKNNPVEHLVQVQITRNPDGKNRVVLAAPKMTVTPGKTGKVSVAEGPVTLEIEATVEPLK